MWFKNVRAFRLTSPFSLSPEQLSDQLAQRLFRALRQIPGALSGLGPAPG